MPPAVSESLDHLLPPALLLAAPAAAADAVQRNSKRQSAAHTPLMCPAVLTRAPTRRTQTLPAASITSNRSKHICAHRISTPTHSIKHTVAGQRHPNDVIARVRSRGCLGSAAGVLAVHRRRWGAGCGPSAVGQPPSKLNLLAAGLSTTCPSRSHPRHRDLARPRRDGSAPPRVGRPTRRRRPG